MLRSPVRKRGLFALLLLLAALVAPASAGAASRVEVPFGADNYRYLQLGLLELDPSGITGGLFDETRLATASAPFGSARTTCAAPAPRTNWGAGTRLVVRKTFTARLAAAGGRVRVRADDDAQVLVNGVPLPRVRDGDCATGDTFALPRTLVPGPNLLAIVATDDDAESYLDAEVTVDYLETDLDGDGDRDYADNCPLVPNPNQADTGGAAGVGDACDFVSDLCEPLCQIVLDQVPGAVLTVDAAASGAGERIFAAYSFTDLIDCDNYKELLAAMYTVDGTPGVGDKRITVLYKWSSLSAGAEQNGASVQVCFSAPYYFAHRSGSKPTGKGTPASWRTALLPDCPRQPAPGSDPCVLSRRTVSNGIEVTFRIPGGPKDPRIRG